MTDVPQEPVRVLGVSGSLRQASYNSGLLAAAGRLLPVGVEFVRYERLKAIPPFDEDDEAEPPSAVMQWRRCLAWADAILVATPEYNSSFPGQLKNAVDWGSRPVANPVLRGKDVAVIGASTGMFGAVWAQADLRRAIAAAGARVVDREFAVCGAHEQFDHAGRLRDQHLESELRETVLELVAEATASIAARTQARELSG